MDRSTSQPRNSLTESQITTDKTFVARRQPKRNETISSSTPKDNIMPGRRKASITRNASFNNKIDPSGSINADSTGSTIELHGLSPKISGSNPSPTRRQKISKSPNPAEFKSINSASALHLSFPKNDIGNQEKVKITTKKGPARRDSIKSVANHNINKLRAIQPPRCATFFEIANNILKFLSNKIIRQLISRLLYIILYAFLVRDERLLGQNAIYNWLYLTGYFVMLTELVIFGILHAYVLNIKEPKFWTPPVAGFILAVLPVLDVLIYYRFIHETVALCSDSMWEDIVRDEIFSGDIDATTMHAQLLIIILVLARWIYKHESTSSDANSMLLIAIIGAGADIVELLDIFETEKLCWLNPKILYWMVVPLYDLSILQFIIVLTEKKDRKVDKNGKDLVHWMWYTEAWGLTLTVFMQDLPFFFLRIVLIIMGDITQTRVFFTCKNFLVCALTLNRVLVIRKSRPKFGSSLVWK